MRNDYKILGLIFCLIGCNSPSSTTQTKGTTQGVSQNGSTTSTAVAYTHFVYVAVGKAIVEFGVDPQTGAMDALNKPTGEPDAEVVNSVIVQNMIISPNGKWLYTISNMGIGNTDGVGQFSIDSKTGLLSAIGTGFTTTTYPTSFAVDAASQNLYSAESTSAIYTFTINQNTGALSYSGNFVNITTQAQLDSFASAHGLTWTTNTTEKTSATVAGNTYLINTPQNRIDLYQNNTLTSYSSYLYEAMNLVVK